MESVIDIEDTIAIGEKLWLVLTFIMTSQKGKEALQFLT